MNQDAQLSYSEIRRRLLNDGSFRKSLMWDIFISNGKAFGIIIALLGIIGWTSLNNLAQSAMKSVLDSQGADFSTQYRRLTNIPSYAVVSHTIVINDSSRNRILLPFFEDLQRQATFEETEWFVTPLEFAGIAIKLKAIPDSTRNSRSYILTSENEIPTGSGGMIHSKGMSTRTETPPTLAKVFLFSHRNTK